MDTVDARIRRVLLGVCAASSCGSSLLFLSPANEAYAASAIPNVAGKWEVVVTDCPGICHDTYTFVATALNTYYVTNNEGFNAPDVVVGPPTKAGTSAFATSRWTCPGCTGWTIEEINFTFPAKGLGTFTGTWLPYSPDGTHGTAVGELTGTQTVSAAPAPVSGWGPSKCKRAYKAWAKTHPHASRRQKKAEARKLNKSHGCKLSVS
jgi:hypothetical protein